MSVRQNHVMVRDIAIATSLAFLVRLLWLRWPSIGGDASEYMALASNLLRHASFSYDGITPSCYRPPGYPAFMTALAAFGLPVVPVTITVQALAGTATVALLYVVSASWFDRRAAFTAAFMMAVAPLSSRFVSVVLTETLFVLLIVAALWAWTRQRPVLTGVFFGLACLTRASALPFLLVIALCALVTQQAGQRKRLVRVIVAAALCIVPWTARNVVQCGHLSVADAGWGANLLYGSVVLKSGSNRWSQLEAQTSHFEDNLGGDDEARARNAAIRRIREDPAGWLYARASQYPWLFLDSGDYLPVAANQISFREAIDARRIDTIALKLAFLVGNAGLLVLAVFGLYVSRRRAKELAPLWAFPVFVAAAHLPMYVEPRYGLPLVPFEVMFAGVAISYLAARMRPLSPEAV